MKNKISTGVLVLLLSMILYVFYDRNRLNDKYSFSVGSIQECKLLPRSGGRITIKYHYQFNDKLLIGSSTRGELSLSDCNEYFIGKRFPVIYSPDKVTLNALLVFPPDFDRFNLAFPDSLAWVLKYKDK